MQGTFKPALLQEDGPEWQLSADKLATQKDRCIHLHWAFQRSLGLNMAAGRTCMAILSCCCHTRRHSYLVKHRDMLTLSHARAFAARPAAGFCPSFELGCNSARCPGKARLGPYACHPQSVLRRAQRTAVPSKGVRTHLTGTMAIEGDDTAGASSDGLAPSFSRQLLAVRRSTSYLCGRKNEGLLSGFSWCVY